MMWFGFTPWGLEDPPPPSPEKINMGNSFCFSSLFFHRVKANNLYELSDYVFDTFLITYFLTIHKIFVWPGCSVG